MRNKIIMLVLSVVLIVGLILTGCVEPVVPPEEPAEEPTPTPAPEEEVIHLTYQAGYGTGDPLDKAQEFFVSRVEKASNGRLVIDHHIGGSIVPLKGVLDGVAAGVLDAATTAPVFNQDLIPTGGLFFAVVGGMSSDAMSAWYDCGGGAELLDRAYGEFNVVVISEAPFVYGVPEIWGHSKDPINSLDDIKGLRMRCMGDSGEIFTRMGASVIFLPGGEIYEAMQRGVLDCMEFSNAAMNWKMGFQEVAKYIYFSSSRSPTEMAIQIVNKDSWEKLPPDLQQVWIDESRAMSHYGANLMRYENILAIQKFKDYGCELLNVPEEVDQELFRVAKEFYDEKCAEDAFFAEIVESQREFQRLYEEMVALDTTLATRLY